MNLLVDYERDERVKSLAAYLSNADDTQLDAVSEKVSEGSGGCGGKCSRCKCKDTEEEGA